MTARTAPTWYDVLGVEPDSGPSDIRSAWRDAIADLDPGDRRFRLLNEAAEVLLDDRRRSAYDDELTGLTGPDARRAEPADDEPSSPARPLWPRRRRSEREATITPVAVVEPEPVPEPSRPATARRGPSAWVLVPLALVTALVVALAAYVLSQPANGRIADHTQDAQSAAERAVTVILAYDYRRMDADQKSADALMTPDYREKYDALFAQLKANSDQVKPVVTAQVLASGIVRSGDDRVQILVFVNRPTTRADGQTTVFHDQVRVTMVKAGSGWLVDDLQTGGSG